MSKSAKSKPLKSSKSADIVTVIDMFELLKNHEDDIFISNLNKYTDLDLNYRDSQENHLITYAIRFNKKRIVSALLDKGSRYDVVDRLGRSILYDAIESNYVDILRIVLEHAQKAIGIMITDIRDSSGSIPIHYAIKFKNITMIQMLIDAGSKLYIADDAGYNSLHIAIKTKDISIVKTITSYMQNLDAKTIKGNTALHIAINYQFTDIATHLIEAGADPNISDDDTDFTPLHYAVGWNNIEIVDILIKHGADVNRQDFYGNTPLTYCIKEKHDRCFDLIIKQKPNLNNWNIDGKIVLHEVLDSYDPSDPLYKKYIDALIEDSNLSYQDAYGNTCLHYLVYLKLWKNYISILEKKRLNIFAKNSNSQMVVDFISEKMEDFSLLINTVVKSYIYLLQKTKKKEWTDEIHKICARNFVDLTDDQIEVLKKNTITKSDKVDSSASALCFGVIKDRILETLKQIRTNQLECCQKSYPSNIGKEISIKEGIMLDITTFTGSLLDILFGLLYLLKKHPNACSTIGRDPNPNQALCDFYRSMGLIMSGRCDLLNFEIVWIDYKLYMIDNFADLFNKCSKSATRWIIIPIGIEMKTGSHANYLIYDKNIKEIERFEPHGGTTPIGFNYNSKQLDDILDRYFTSIDQNIKYIRPETYIPKIGFQMMDSQEERTYRIGDPGGFCALWSIWYVDQRLEYPHYSRDKLIKLLFSNIHEKGIKYRNLIRNYSRNIIRERDDVLASVGLSINDWLNERYSNQTLDELMLRLYDELRKVKKE